MSRDLRKDSKYRKNKVVSGKDLFIVVLALGAVMLFIVFLLFVNKEQSKQNEQLEQLSQQEETEVLFTQISEDICINEICKEGWIEIYNRNGITADLSGYQVVCGESDVVLPKGTVIENRGFLAIDISIKEGTSVEIYGIDDILYDSVYIPKLEKNESFGRKDDGDLSFCYLSSTKGKTNSVAGQIPKDFFYFDIQSGFYNQDLQVEIIGPEGWQVYYTLDGTDPDIESNIYEGCINISNRTVEENIYSALTDLSIRTSRIPRDKVEKCTLIRAIAIDGEGNKSQEITASYFVANGKKSMYNNLPVIVISAQPDELFGYEKGIYSSGKIYEDALASETADNTSANYYADYTADAFVQYFSKDKQLKAEGKGVLQTYNDGFLDYVQKSLLLTLKDGNFLLNAGGNDYELKIRDMYMQKVMQDTEAKMIDMQPCIVFLEGEYWGVYLLQRMMDEHALENQYGISSDNIVCVVGGRSTDPAKQSYYDELYGYVVGSNLANKKAYKRLEEMMDIQSYLDCYCAHMYIADSDWMSANDVAWRTISLNGQDPNNDGKWRFVFSGADFGMGSSILSSSSINTYLRPAVQNDAFLYSLMRNQDFKQRYMETMKKYAEEVFIGDKIEKDLKELSNIYQKGIQASYSRFSGNVTDGAYNGGIDTIKDFFQNRKEYILKYTQEFIDMERKEIRLQTNSADEAKEQTDTSMDKETIME